MDDLELYIQIRDGQPYEHPIFGDNLRHAFPGIDTDNLPETFAKFVRVPVPNATFEEVYDHSTYVWGDGFVTEVHHMRSRTQEEIDALTKLPE